MPSRRYIGLLDSGLVVSFVQDRWRPLHRIRDETFKRGKMLYLCGLAPPSPPFP